MDKVKIGIIGAGRLGGFHADKVAASNDAVLVGVFDPYLPNRMKVAEKHGVRAFSDLDSLLQEVDAAVVASVSSQHASLGNAVLSSGRHLLMEKPMTVRAKDALYLSDLANTKGRIFQVGHTEQYNPAWLAAADSLSDVRAGAPCVIEAHRQSIYTFRCVDIGAVLDLMIHDIELVLSLIPSPIQSVNAHAFTRMGGYEDAAFATLTFENGSIAFLNASRVESGPVRNMTICSDSARVHLDFQSRTSDIFMPDTAVRNGEFAPDKVSPQRVPELVPTFMKDHFITKTETGSPVDPLALEMENFTQAILHGTPSRVPAVRAAHAIEVAELILNAIRKAD